MHYLLAVAAAILSAVVAPWVGADGAGILTMAPPLLAVLLMLLVVTRDGYRQAGWQRLGLHRAGRSAWGLAVLGPLLVLSATYAMVWGSALGHFVWPTEGGVVDLILDLVIGLVVAVGLALAEEIGWRGYFLPHLAGIGRTRALLLSGCLHGCWHLPLMLLTPYYHGDGSRWLIIPRFLLTLTAAGVFYGYLRLTSHSLWPVAVAHGAFNTLWGQFAALTTAGAAPLRLAYLAGESRLPPRGGNRRPVRFPSNRKCGSKSEHRQMAISGIMARVVRRFSGKGRRSWPCHCCKPNSIPRRCARNWCSGISCWRACMAVRTTP